MNAEHPLILVSNDDGVEAEGLAALAAALRPLGEIVVCAPARERSASGHAITVSRDLEYREVRDEDDAVWAHALDGTPADCVKFGLRELLGGRRPDLVVSGVNRGPNTGVNILYSGTVAAAVEGALNGVPSIAVSLNAARDAAHRHFDTAGVFARRVARRTLSEGLPEWTVLNVNVPNLPLERIEGVSVTRMSRTMFRDRFEAVHARDGRTRYRNAGDELALDLEAPDRDDGALREHRVSITPLRLDLTRHEWRQTLAAWLDAIEEDPD